MYTSTARHPVPIMCCWAALLTAGFMVTLACIGVGTVFLDAASAAKLSRVQGTWPRAMTRATVAGVRGLHMTCSFASMQLKKLEGQLVASASAAGTSSSSPAVAPVSVSVPAPAPVPVSTSLPGTPSPPPTTCRIQESPSPPPPMRTRILGPDDEE
jgi:hypothetical protein